MGFGAVHKYLMHYKQDWTMLLIKETHYINLGGVCKYYYQLKYLQITKVYALSAPPIEIPRDQNYSLLQNFLHF